MLSERHEKDAIKKALTEAQEKNEELLMKVEDANEKIEQLQTTIDMCVPFPMLGQWFILLYIFTHPIMCACVSISPSFAISDYKVVPQ